MNSATSGRDLARTDSTRDGPDVEVPATPTRLSGRALVTNDDGVESPGLYCLARAVRDAGLEPVIVAPDRNMSGAGTGIGQFDIDAGVGFQPVPHDDLEVYAISGPPGLAVLSAALGAFGGLPDLVVSGVNAGANTGHSIIHSGTVGAALTARTFGCSGLAVSLGPSDHWQWDTAEAAARVLCGWMAAMGRRDVVVNANIPGIPAADIRGIRWARLESFGHIRVASADHEGRRVEYGVRGQDEDSAPDSDHVLLAQNFITVTALDNVDETDPLGPDLPTW